MVTFKRRFSWDYEYRIKDYEERDYLILAFKIFALTCNVAIYIPNILVSHLYQVVEKS